FWFHSPEPEKGRVRFWCERAATRSLRFISRRKIHRRSSRFVMKRACLRRFNYHRRTIRSLIFSRARPDLNGARSRVPCPTLWKSNRAGSVQRKSESVFLRTASVSTRRLLKRSIVYPKRLTNLFSKARSQAAG